VGSGFKSEGCGAIDDSVCHLIISSLFEIRPQGSIKQYTVNIKTDTERKNTVQYN